MLTKEPTVPREEGAKVQTVSGCNIARGTKCRRGVVGSVGRGETQSLKIQKDMPLLLVPQSPGKRNMKEEARGSESA